MNIIKFRICYTAQNGEKRMIYDDNRYLIGLNGEIYENYGLDWKTPMWEVPYDVANPPILQHFTGCHDKNKKEIWEGDEIRYGHQIGTVEFFAGSFICNWGDQTDDNLGHLMIDKIEVVGNIFKV